MPIVIVNCADCGALKPAGAECLGDGIRWQVYQVANDVAEYGKNAGRHLITTTDAEQEITGFMDPDAAQQIVDAHNWSIAVASGVKDPCVECFRSTAWGSGLFVNRVPSGRNGHSGYQCSDCQMIDCDGCGQKTLEYALVGDRALCVECCPDGEG